MIPFVLLLSSAFALSIRYYPPWFQYGARFVMVATAFYLLLMLGRKSIAVTAMALVLFSQAILSSAYPINPHPIRSILQSVVFLAGLGAYLAGVEYGKRLVPWLVAVGAIVASGILILRDPRGFISCANTSATMALAMIPLAILGGKTRLLVPLAAITLYFTGSRGAWLAGGVVLVLYFTKSAMERKWKWIIGLGLLALSTTHTGFLDSPGRWDNHWKHHLARHDASPWIGTGLLSSYPHLAHNDYLQIQADLGWIGLGVFLVLIFTMFIRSKNGAPLAIMAMTAIALHAAVDFPLMVPLTFVTFCACAGISKNNPTEAALE